MMFEIRLKEIIRMKMYLFVMLLNEWKRVKHRFSLLIITK